MPSSVPTEHPRYLQPLFGNDCELLPSPPACGCLGPACVLILWDPQLGGLFPDHLPGKFVATQFCLQCLSSGGQVFWHLNYKIELHFVTSSNSHSPEYTSSDGKRLYLSTHECKASTFTFSCIVSTSILFYYPKLTESRSPFQISTSAFVSSGCGKVWGRIPLLTLGWHQAHFVA